MNEEEAEQEQGITQPTNSNGMSMEDRLESVITKHLAAVCRAEQCSESDVKSIAEIVHYGWYRSSQTYPVLDLDKIKDNAVLSPKDAKDFLKKLISVNVVVKERKGLGLNHSDNFTCSPELKNFVQEIRSLRKPQR